MLNRLTVLVSPMKQITVLSLQLVFWLVLVFNATAVQAMSATVEAKATEQYGQALGLITQQHYSDAVASLRLIQRNYPQFSKIASVQTRIAVLHEASKAGDSIDHYLQALNQRDDLDIDGALNSLERLLVDFPDTSLRDDALYLKAYIEVMAKYDFRKAQLTLSQLMTEFTEGAYQDSAEYLDGIILEQLGETELAIARFKTLRDQHTALSLPLEFNWPKDNVLSRYWFDRADKRLSMLNLQIASASVVRSVDKTSKRGDLIVEVSVAGDVWQLELWPSSMLRDTSWLDGSFSDSEPPTTAFYEGEVLGADSSWVRAVISDGEISGVFEADGVEFKMEPGTLIGTLDYYQPQSQRRRTPTSPDSTSVDAVLDNDTRLVPDEDVLNLINRVQTIKSDIQVVPLSIVIDKEFDRYYGGQGLATALNELNVADGIYRKFNLALALDKVQVFGKDDTDPVIEGPATLESYMRSFREYRLDQRALFSSSVLSYLFTGKNNTDLNLGIAWIGSICRTDGYDVGVTTPSAIGGVLLTHEIAHSLGAVHDDVTSCKSETDKLMWPYLSTDTKSVFSDCSKENLSGANTKSCLVDGVDVDVSVVGDSNEIVVSLFNPDSIMPVNGILKLESNTLDILLLPEECTVSGTGAAECMVRNLSPKETRKVVISLNTAVVNEQTVVSIEMTSMDVLDYSKKNNVSEFWVMSGLAMPTTVDPQESSFESAESSGGGGGSVAFMPIFLVLLAFRSKWRYCRELRNSTLFFLSEFLLISGTFLSECHQMVIESGWQGKLDSVIRKITSLCSDKTTNIIGIEL